jgi:putative membrane-bound dehydrogenase-like protein
MLYSNVLNYKIKQYMTSNWNLIAIVAFLSFSCGEEHYKDALSPEEALESFQLHEGFEIEIFAAEPHVMDPVSMVFDESGNIYVVEMPDYPYKPEPGKGQGKIKMLRDSDGDGRIDESSVFAENLSEATSVLPWKDGLLVTSAPYILYLQDTDGDFVADSREELFSGFFENNSEAQITNLRFGIDNWIYAANNGQHGEVTSSLKPEAPALMMRGADFRFRLDSVQFEKTTGPAQFGQTLDDYGHRFFTQNTIHLQQVVIPRRYAFRHEHLPSTTSITNISDHDLIMFQETPPPYWRAERTRRRNETYQEQNLDRTEYAEDHFTGASGGTMYLGDAFPEEFYGNIFTGEVAGNLVHRDVLTPHAENPTYVASRAEEETAKEFLASTDPWFRPANFTVGPDGYLYVIDMYRQHIETPVSIPDDLKEDMDFDYGKEHGRIYRIKPKNERSREIISPDLKSKTTADYVELLAHPNQWWRLQAQRLLLEKQDASSIPAVQAVFEQNEDSRARVHALYALDGLNALTVQTVQQAMKDPHPGVREHGIMLAERFEECLPLLLEMTGDSTVRVAFQATLSLGEFSGPEVVDALAHVVEQYGQNSWFKTAVLSSEPGSSLALLQKLVSAKNFFEGAEEGRLSFLEDFSHVIGSRNQTDQVDAYLDLISSSFGNQEEWQRAGINGLIKGFGKSWSPERKEGLKSQEDYAGMAVKEVIDELRGLVVKG